jgi:ABC-type branched-subunit amino acid transport system permease subunit
VSIGVDRWADSAGERTEEYAGWGAPVVRRWLALPPLVRLAVLAALFAALPAVTSSDFIIRVGINALLLALLAVGLNVVVGWAGLLDLGFVAFYGFGAYGYALLASDQIGVHLPPLLGVPIVVVAAAFLGLLLGLPSGRLLGDYLAIVTLFFGQVFVELVLNLDRLSLPGSSDRLNITGGPNGIVGIDPISVPGFEFVTPTSYFYLLLGLICVVAVVLFLIDDSRTGRAWRAVREDPLAAQVMTMPVNRLKLMAFATGAAIAGLAGTVFAAFQIGVFPRNFETEFLILIYAALILGGAGSLAGAVVGAVVLTFTLDLLRDPDQASIAFYGVVALTLVARTRPWARLGAIVAGTVAFGFAVHAIVGAVSERAVGGHPLGSGALADVVDAWVVLPTEPKAVGNWGFCALVLGVLALVKLRGRARTLLLIPVLYLAAFVWENRLVAEPSVTRQLLLGATLVVLMNARPQGLLGEPRVERV